MSYDKVPQGATLKVEPYKMNVPQEEVDLFYQLIKLSKLAPKTYENLQKDENIFGVTHEWMTNAKSHWANSYNWREREAYFNSFPNFMTQIKDDHGYTFDIHFAALFSEKPDAVPIVFLHGWPGNFLEFLGVMTVLKNKYSAADLPYHIIAPSLPGYGLSSGPPLDRDFRTEDIAAMMDKLMVGLGFGNGYIGQGGDIGAYTCRPLSTHPSCKAIHLNFSWMPPRDDVPASEIDALEQKGLERAKGFGLVASAYALEHGTRPATIGFVLSSSPIALLAWIAEKFITWTDTTPPLDAILDNISFYWFTESFPRCIYPYRQFHNTTGPTYTIHDDPKYFINTLGYSYFPQELAPMPVAYVKKTGNLIFHRQHKEGGHFAAMEKPELLVGDVEEFVKLAWKQ